MLDEAAVEFEDDDYWDVESDEEMIDTETCEDENALLTSREFATIRRIHLENSNELGIRRYDAFLYDGLLSHYKPEYAASPLRNPKTARVFAHFIHVVSTTQLLRLLHVCFGGCVFLLAAHTVFQVSASKELTILTDSTNAIHLRTKP